MPRLARVPGFVRLPTEHEWEFAARGGQPAVTAGNFDQRLPLRPSELYERTWTLSGYGRDYDEAALETLANSPLAPRGGQGHDLARHPGRGIPSQRRTDPDLWRTDVEETLRSFVD